MKLRDRQPDRRRERSEGNEEEEKSNHDWRKVDFCDHRLHPPELHDDASHRLGDPDVGISLER